MLQGMKKGGLYLHICFQVFQIHKLKLLNYICKRGGIQLLAFIKECCNYQSRTVVILHSSGPKLRTHFSHVCFRALFFFKLWNPQCLRNQALQIDCSASKPYRFFKTKQNIKYCIECSLYMSMYHCRHNINLRPILLHLHYQCNDHWNKE